MITAFFESIKYVGHLYPMAILRIYVGYYWFSEGRIRFKENIFSSQLFIDDIRSRELFEKLPDLYQSLYTSLVAPYWTVWSHGFMTVEVVVGLGLILGFLTRPLGVVAIIMCLHYIMLGTEIVGALYSTFCAILIVLVVSGAGRCMGFDYYFFKRNRGILW